MSLATSQIEIYWDRFSDETTNSCSSGALGLIITNRIEFRNDSWNHRSQACLWEWYSLRTGKALSLIGKSVNPLFLWVIFNSYVSLQDGTYVSLPEGTIRWPKKGLGNVCESHKMKSQSADAIKGQDLLHQEIKHCILQFTNPYLSARPRHGKILLSHV